MVTKKKIRNFPKDSLEDALAVPQKIMDEMGGKPFKRLLLAESLGITPSSSNFRDLLSSSYKYGLTEGTEKASEISLTEIGKDATQNKDSVKRMAAIRTAAMKPVTLNKFYTDYLEKKMPSPDMLNKIIVSSYGIPEEYASEFGVLITENGRFAGIVREIGGSPHIMLDLNLALPESEIQEGEKSSIPAGDFEKGLVEEVQQELSTTSVISEDDRKHKPIFIGHGKNKKPLEKLQKFLSSFQIPYKVTIDEANLGRPITQKVRETMLQCGSAILIFTCDEKYFDENNNEIWKPSENVVHELGAASFQYEDRIVIFKEKGLHFPTNFQSIGYIEFEVDSIDAKTAELLKELIGFGLVKVTPT